MLHLCEVFMSLIITARKRSLGQGNIFTPVCHSVHGGRAWLLRGGCVCGCSQGVACMVAPGGACVVALGGRAWLLWGVCVVAPGGVACVVAPGGEGACVGYNEIRRYDQ